MNRFESSFKPVKKYLSLGIAALLVGASPAWALGPTPVNLGTAGDFMILSKSGITNVPTSVITGNVGTSPITGGAITGLTCPEVTGTIYTVDAAGPACRVVDAPRLTTAVLDMEAAYTNAAGRAADVTELGAGDISGLTLAPGVYKWGTAVSINTDVTLAGSATDVWIFQIAGGLTQAAATKVILANGALAKNIFWQVAGVASMGANAHFEGVILSKTSATLVTGAVVNGRLLAQTNVTLQSNTVTQPAPGGGNVNPPRQRCNQGVGNGPEGCDPGNSNQGNPFRSNDERGGVPGDPGRKGGNQL